LGPRCAGACIPSTGRMHPFARRSGEPYPLRFEPGIRRACHQFDMTARIRPRPGGLRLPLLGITITSSVRLRRGLHRAHAAAAWGEERQGRHLRVSIPPRGSSARYSSTCRRRRLEAPAWGAFKVGLSSATGTDGFADFPRVHGRRTGHFGIFSDEMAAGRGRGRAGPWIGIRLHKGRLYATPTLEALLRKNKAQFYEKQNRWP